MQVQLQRLADQQLIKAAVLAQDERIVKAGDQQDIVHAKGHQVLEALEEVLRSVRQIGSVPDRHYESELCYFSCRALSYTRTYSRAEASQE